MHGLYTRYRPKGGIHINTDNNIHNRHILTIDYFFPESPYTKELAKEILQHDLDMTFVCKKYNKSDYDKLLKPHQTNGEELNILYDGGGNKVRAIVLYGEGLFKLRKKIFSKKYDVVHVQGFKSQKYEMPIYIQASKAGIPIVHTVHNVLPHESEESLKKLHQEFYDACSALIVHNETTAKELCKIFDIEVSKLHIIPHGTYTEYQVAPKKLSEKRTFLVFGNIRKYKGIDILIDAVSQIPSDILSNMQVIVCGKQFPKLDPTDYQKRITDAGLEECITFSNDYVKEEDIPNYYNNADFCVFPYRSIYGSGALMMAYTFRKPVIVSNIDTFIEETNCGNTGLFFEQLSPASLAETLTYAMQMGEDEYQRYQNNIDMLVNTKYNWKKSADMLADVYANVCRKGKDE